MANQDTPKQPSTEKEPQTRLYNRGRKDYTLFNGVMVLPKRAIMLPVSIVDRYTKAYPKDLVRYDDLEKLAEAENKPKATVESLSKENLALKAELEQLRELQASALAGTEADETKADATDIPFGFTPDEEPAAEPAPVKTRRTPAQVQADMRAAAAKVAAEKLASIQAEATAKAGAKV